MCIDEGVGVDVDMDVDEGVSVDVDVVSAFDAAAARRANNCRDGNMMKCVEGTTQ